ncbi:hypothetical protein FHS11_003593 [Mucilaginibacter gotjawali]|uniref:Uncharacterized protein n=1 Tax=Mucilaginibacter gotjawali TaxID=1550579 RepID=A0A839SFT5_9SPHI|nr:hypothetical protein [Mucilaginibacter gotjawali]
MLKLYIVGVFFCAHQWVVFKNNPFNYRISSKLPQNSLKIPKCGKNGRLGHIYINLNIFYK